jgi:transposase
MLDELVFEKRKRLLQLVEVEGRTPEEASKEMGVSLSTFYKYRRRWKMQGDAGLLDKKLRADSGMKQVPYEVRKEVLNIVREWPEYGTKRIMEELNARGMSDIDQTGLYEELVRMRMNTKKLRLEYIDRTGALSPEMRAELDKELLKEKERKEKAERIDRDAYLEEIKQSIGEKRKAGEAEELRIFEKLKEIEPLLGDTNLYGDIAAELAKLGQGKDLAALFEKLILQMAKTKLDSLSVDSGRDSEPATGEIEEKRPELTGEPDQESAAGAPAKSKSLPADFPESVLSPIDVSNAASETEEKTEKAEEIDWKSYAVKLEQKFNKK